MRMRGALRSDIGGDCPEFDVSTQPWAASSPLDESMRRGRSVSSWRTFSTWPRATT